MKHQAIIRIIFLIGIASPTTFLTGQEAIRRLTQEEAVKAAVNKPQPEYPSIARQLKIQGRVEVEVSIDATGAVENVKPLTGNPALAGTVVSTLKHWHFEPILAEGKPTRAVAVMGFSFKP
jgi:TonB family protein